MSLNILAVDDSRTMRDMIRLALEPAGFTVTTADDGVHGVAVLEGLTPDAIITDINIPRIAGFLQGDPALVLAPHLIPGQSGPNRQCSAASLKLVPM